MAFFMNDKLKLQLIDAVRKNPPLYDVKREDYKDNNIRQLCWEKVSQEVQKPVSDCRKVWEILRNSYRRCKKDEQKMMIGANGSRKPKWRFFDKMQFLNEFFVMLPEGCYYGDEGNQSETQSQDEYPSPMVSIAHLVDVCMNQIGDTNSHDMSQTEGTMKPVKIEACSDEDSDAMSSSLVSANSAACSTSENHHGTKRSASFTSSSTPLKKQANGFSLRQDKQLGSEHLLSTEQLKNLTELDNRVKEELNFAYDIARTLNTLDPAMKQFVKFKIHELLFKATANLIAMPEFDE